ncbi:MAG: hypothetical protein GWP20_01075 [Thermotogales bacterium]|nr:hypothetical protein [Thermotogales bacterium]
MKLPGFERLFFLSAAAFFVFLYGFLAYHYELFPSYYLKRAVEQAEMITGKSLPHHMHYAVYDREGASFTEPAAIQPGLTLLTSYWPDLDWRSGIRLIDLEGKVLHQWQTDPVELFPDESRLANGYVHGSYLFPNGDVLFNIEYGGLVMMDACGKVKWKLGYKNSNYVTHHCLTRNQKGNFWVCGQVRRYPGEPEAEEYIKQFAGLKLPLYEDRILEVSPEGQILQDINLLDVFYKNDLQRFLVKYTDRRSKDAFHLNDIEDLPEQLAAQFPMFAVGDLVLSMRGINMILVLEPGTGKVKWYTTDPFLAQHDPDFTDDGWITVFDNHMDYTERGTMLGGSRILAIRPHTGETRVVYPVDEDNGFYTRLGGKWQQLENGNILITEARAGRAFEVAPGGRTVWEWIHQRLDDKLVPEVLEASRYPITPEQVATWSCSPGDE